MVFETGQTMSKHVQEAAGQLLVLGASGGGAKSNFYDGEGDRTARQWFSMQPHEGWRFQSFPLH